MGGLMSNQRTQSENGVPGLMNIPLIGRLFKSTSTSTTKTELLVMIVPYIIENDEEAASITRAVTSQLENFEMPAPLQAPRSEEHTSELQSLMRNTSAVLPLQNKTRRIHKTAA